MTDYGKPMEAWAADGRRYIKVEGNRGSPPITIALPPDEKQLRQLEIIAKHLNSIRVMVSLGLWLGIGAYIATVVVHHI